MLSNNVEKGPKIRCSCNLINNDLLRRIKNSFMLQRKWKKGENGWVKPELVVLQAKLAIDILDFFWGGMIGKSALILVRY